MVSKNAQPALVDNIHQILGVKVVTTHAKYLGLSTVQLRNCSQMFQSLLDKLWNKPEVGRLSLYRKGKTGSHISSFKCYLSILVLLFSSTGKSYQETTLYH
ncbi:hypothetical protein QQ045_022108 [Rhodiola kirilowii]